MELASSGLGNRNWLAHNKGPGLANMGSGNRRCPWNWVGFRGNTVKQMIHNPLARCSGYCSKFWDVHRPWLRWDRVR